MRKWFNKQTAFAFILGAVLFSGIGVGAATGVLFNLSKDTLYVDGKKIDKPLYIYGGINHAPIRVIADALGLDSSYKDGKFMLSHKLTDLETVVKNCKDSCVMIYAYGQDDKGQWTSQGSGFAYKGYIITANHVVHPSTEADEIYVYPDDSLYGKEAARAAIDTTLDVAVLKCGLQLPSVKLGDSDKLIEGEKLVSITSPGGTQNVVDESINSGLAYVEDGIFLTISEANTSPGSSGGPIFNYNNEVIGMVIKGGDGISDYAIPINDIKPILQNLK